MFWETYTEPWTPFSEGQPGALDGAWRPPWPALNSLQVLVDKMGGRRQI